MKTTNILMQCQKEDLNITELNLVSKISVMLLIGKG